MESKDNALRSGLLLDENNQPRTALYMTTGFNKGGNVEDLVFKDAEINGLEKYITDCYRKTDINTKVGLGSFYEVVFNGRMEKPEKLKTYDEVMMFLDHYGYRIDESTERKLAFCCLDMRQRPPISETEQNQKAVEIASKFSEWIKANEQGLRSEFRERYGDKQGVYYKDVRQSKLKFPKPGKSRSRGI